LRKDTNGTGDTEENGVVVGFRQAVILEENTTVCVYIGESEDLDVSFA
jgi:hypothetical protein